MGMIVIPYLLLSIALYIIALVIAYQQNRKTKFDSKESVSGLAVSLVIYLAIISSYIAEGSWYAFSPYLRLPGYMIILPFLFVIFTIRIKIPKLQSFSRIVLLSILFSGILAIVLSFFAFPLLECNGIMRYY